MFLEYFEILISILSLAATITISIILYKIEKKHSIEIAKENEKIRIHNLEHEAEIFVIKNGEEIDYLPLCVFASNLNKTQKHRRKIFNNFNMCPHELKIIILKKQNVSIKKLPKADWFDFCIEKLIKDIEIYKLGKNLFYDNAKYTSNCFTLYSKNKIPNIDENIFEIQDYSIRNNNFLKRNIHKVSLYSYIHGYLHFIQDNRKYENLKKIEITPPCNYVYDISVNNKDDIYSYWNAQTMRYLCCLLRGIKSTKNFFAPYSPTIEIQVEFFEDLYYCAMYELYLTYGKKL